MGDDTGTKPKKRRARAELRELMITAGVEVLEATGVELQISSVSYARVFEHLERTTGIRVTYGSVHERIWDSLHDYQLSVIERSGIWDTPADESDGPTRLDELIATADLHAVPDDIWTAWLTTIVALRSQSADTEVADAARLGAEATYRRLEQRFATTVGAALRELGYRPDERFADEDEAWSVLARLSLAVADGLALRRTLTAESEPDIEFRSGPEGEPETWTSYSLAMWALTGSVLRPA